MPARTLLAAALIGVAAMAMPAPIGPNRQQDSFVGLVAEWSPLPAGLQVAIADADTHLVAVIAADIDDDGDLDVVASDSTLQLYVWVNDGAGHLRRQRPARSRSLQPEPTGPTIEDTTSLSPVPTQKDPRPLRAGTEVQPVPLVTMRRATTASSRAVLPATLASHTPRAPPASPAAA